MTKLSFSSLLLTSCNFALTQLSVLPQSAEGAGFGRKNGAGGLLLASSRQEQHREQQEEEGIKYADFPFPVPARTPKSTSQQQRPVEATELEATAEISAILLGGGERGHLQPGSDFSSPRPTFHGEGVEYDLTRYYRQVCSTPDPYAGARPGAPPPELSSEHRAGRGVHYHKHVSRHLRKSSNSPAKSKSNSHGSRRGGREQQPHQRDHNIQREELHPRQYPRHPVVPPDCAKFFAAAAANRTAAANVQLHGAGANATISEAEVAAGTPEARKNGDLHVRDHLYAEKPEIAAEGAGAGPSTLGESIKVPERETTSEIKIISTTQDKERIEGAESNTKATMGTDVADSVDLLRDLHLADGFTEMEFNRISEKRDRRASHASTAASTSAGSPPWAEEAAGGRGAWPFYSFSSDLDADNDEEEDIDKDTDPEVTKITALSSINALGSTAQEREELVERTSGILKSSTDGGSSTELLPVDDHDHDPQPSPEQVPESEAVVLLDDDDTKSQVANAELVAMFGDLQLDHCEFDSQESSGREPVRFHHEEATNKAPAKEELDHGPLSRPYYKPPRPASGRNKARPPTDLRVNTTAPACCRSSSLFPAADAGSSPESPEEDAEMKSYLNFPEVSPQSTRVPSASPSSAGGSPSVVGPVLENDEPVVPEGEHGGEGGCESVFKDLHRAPPAVAEDAGHDADEQTRFNALLEESLKSSCWTVSTSCKGTKKVDTKGAASASRTTAVGVGAEAPGRNDKNDIGNMASLSSSKEDNGETHPTAPAESLLHDGKEILRGAKQAPLSVLSRGPREDHDQKDAEPVIIGVARQIQDQDPSRKPLLQREKEKPFSYGSRKDHHQDEVSTRSRKSAGIVQEHESKVLETTASRTRSKPRGTTSPRRAAVCSPRRRRISTIREEVLSPQNKKPAGPARMTLRELTNGEVSSSSSDDDVQLLTQVPTSQALDEGFSASMRKSAHLRSPTNNEIKIEHEKRRQVLMNKIAAPALSKEDMAYITRKVGTLSGRLSSPDSASPPPLARGHRRGSSSSRHHKRRGASSSAETRPHDLRKAAPSLNSVMEKCSSQEPPLVQLSEVDVDSASSTGVEVLRLSRSAGAVNLDAHYRAGLDLVQLRDRGGTTPSVQMKNPVTAELKREQRLQYVEHMCSSIPGTTSDVEVLYFHLYELQKFAKTRLQALDTLARLAVRVDVAAVETSRSKRHGRSRSANKREGPTSQSSSAPLISRAALALTLLHNLVHEEMPATWKFRAQGEELLEAAVERLRSLKSAVAESVLEVYEGMTAQKTNAKQSKLIRPTW
ncbi:unnamed protein product [Amoebophrya sp. A120]|nr:unnamed protein product [Amoebophrya sp. A120]|eukprot:GSA120T00008023001.1